MLISNKGENLRNMYIPAETKVAECIKAEAGTGASIESGSQIWNPNWADFIKEAIIKLIIIISEYFKLHPKKFIELKVVKSMNEIKIKLSNEKEQLNIKIMIINIKESLNLLNE